MKTLLQLQQARDTALAAIKSAKTDEARAAAVAALDVASQEVATFQAKLGASKKYVKKTEEERYEEEDEDADDEDAEEDEDADDEPKEKKSKKSKAKDDTEEKSEEDDEDGDDDEEEDDDEDASAAEEEDDEEESEAKAAALLTSASGTYSYGKLFQLCQELTGKKSVREVFGGMGAIGLRLEGQEKMEARIAKIEQRGRKDRVVSMLTTARRDGKITKAQAESLKAKGQDDPRWLKGYLDVLPKRVRTTEEGAAQGKALDGSKDGDRRDVASLAEDKPELLDAQNLDAETRKMIQQMASGTGKTVADFVAEMNKTAEARAERTKTRAGKR